MGIGTCHHRNHCLYIPGFSRTDLRTIRKNDTGGHCGICAMTVVYHCVEGVITTLLAKQYNRALH